MKAGRCAPALERQHGFTRGEAFRMERLPFLRLLRPDPPLPLSRHKNWLAEA
jgi:hypothetical protein